MMMIGCLGYEQRKRRQRLNVSCWLYKMASGSTIELDAKSVDLTSASALLANENALLRARLVIVEEGARKDKVIWIWI
jgi:hypothetical protein